MSTSGESVSVAPTAVPEESPFKKDPIPVTAVTSGDVVASNPVATDEPAVKKAKTEGNEVSETKTPAKERTPRKKGLSQAERTQREAEALIGDLNKEGSAEGSRRTRSQTRGTPAESIVQKISPKPRAAPVRRDTPAVKRTPTTPGSSSAKKGRGRGRGRKGRRGGKKTDPGKTGEEGPEGEGHEDEGPEDEGHEDEGNDQEADATDADKNQVVNENGQSSESEGAKEEEAPVQASLPVPESSPIKTPIESKEESPKKTEVVPEAVKEIPSSLPSSAAPVTESVNEDGGWN